MQDDLLGLSTNSTQVEVADATHETLLTNEDTAAEASDAIAAVVEAVRTGTPSRTKAAEMKTPHHRARRPRLASPSPAAEPRAPTHRSTRRSRRRSRSSGPPTPIDDIFDGRRRSGSTCTAPAQGDTTVVLIAGWGARGDESWSAVQPALAEHARVCTYDRPGTGTSDAPATDQTFETQAADLRALLDTAGEPGPYVVVGHSFGGRRSGHVRGRATTTEVTGLVLVDASPTTWPAAVCAVPDDGTEAGAATASSARSCTTRRRIPSASTSIPAFEHVAAITSLGDLPLTVITADTRTAPGLAADELDAAQPGVGRGRGSLGGVVARRRPS